MLKRVWFRMVKRAKLSFRFRDNTGTLYIWRLLILQFYPSCLSASNGFKSATATPLERDGRRMGSCWACRLISCDYIHHRKGRPSYPTWKRTYMQHNLYQHQRNSIFKTRRLYFKVEAASDQTYLYTSKKQSWLIIIQNIYLLKISAIIQDTGRRKMVRNSINLLPPNALNMIANTL